VLEQLLHQQHGFKLGVVVNDLASVNVDANVLRDAISNSGSQSVQLENGCVCCTAADDLQESVQSLLRDAGSKQLDAIVVELSGVAEPARVKKALEAPAESISLSGKNPLSVRTVTVVDSPAFATDYLREQSAHHNHAHTASGECDDRYGTLLAEQVESADLLLLNKADMATEEELSATQEMVKVLNGSAALRITEYGKVEVDELLDAEPKVLTDAHHAENIQNLEAAAVSPDNTAEPVKACCIKKTCSATNKESAKECSSKSKSEETRSRAETRFGITSFVYSTERIMSRAKLMKLLDDWYKARDNLGNKLSILGLGNDAIKDPTNAANMKPKGTAISSPLAPVLRSKGTLLLDSHPKVQFFWSHAGKCINFSQLGPWEGARRTEVVFIGKGYDETAIRDLLDSCLLSDDDLAFLKKMGVAID